MGTVLILLRSLRHSQGGFPPEQMDTSILEAWQYKLPLHNIPTELFTMLHSISNSAAFT